MRRALKLEQISRFDRAKRTTDLEYSADKNLDRAKNTKNPFIRDYNQIKAGRKISIASKWDGRAKYQRRREGGLPESPHEKELGVDGFGSNDFTKYSIKPKGQYERETINPANKSYKEDMKSIKHTALLRRQLGPLGRKINKIRARDFK